MQTYIVLMILLFMIVMFFTHPVPYGVTTMLCCAMLCLFGIFDLKTAFSGLSNKTTLLVASMFTIAYAFGKTSVVNVVRSFLDKIKGKSGNIFIIFLFLITILLGQLMGRTAIVSIVALFLTTLDDDDEICGSRMIFATFAVLAAWHGKIPIGMGATMYAMINAKYEGIIENPNLLLKTTDVFKVAIIPAIILFIYCLFAWRLIPKNKINTTDVKQVKENEALPKRTETIINLIFCLVMIGFIFGSKIGEKMYLLPVIGVLALVLTKCLTIKETVTALTSDMVWMIAGVLVVSDAIGKSGAGDLIGNTILNILGHNPSGLFVLFVFAIATIVMTTFMSNTGTSSVLIPIAASLSKVGGMDPRGIIIVIEIASVMAIAFPSGSAECALAYAIGRHSPGKMLKFTLPYLAIAIVSIVFCANAFFPVYG